MYREVSHKAEQLNQTWNQNCLVGLSYVTVTILRNTDTKNIDEAPCSYYYEEQSFWIAKNNL